MRHIRTFNISLSFDFFCLFQRHFETNNTRFDISLHWWNNLNHKMQFYLDLDFKYFDIIPADDIYLV